MRRIKENEGDLRKGNKRRPKCPSCRGIPMRHVIYHDNGHRVLLGYICGVCGTYKLKDYIDKMKLTEWKGKLYIGLKVVIPQ